MKYKYVEMYIDEMKRTKKGIQNTLIEFKTKKNRILCIPETKENRMDILCLCEHYNDCIEILNRVKSMYSKMINIAENDELDEDDFRKRIKEIQRVHNEVAKEREKNLIKKLESKYIQSDRSIKNIVNI